MSDLQTTYRYIVSAISTLKKAFELCKKIPILAVLLKNTKIIHLQEGLDTLKNLLHLFTISRISNGFYRFL